MRSASSALVMVEVEDLLRQMTVTLLLHLTSLTNTTNHVNQYRPQHPAGNHYI